MKLAVVRRGRLSCSGLAALVGWVHLDGHLSFAGRDQDGKVAGRVLVAMVAQGLVFLFPVLALLNKN